VGEERDPKRMYEELLSYYRRYYLQPRRFLDREIAKRVSAGMSWEEAVASLYREAFKVEREAPREEARTGLDAALESLKTAESRQQGLSIALALAFILVFLAAAVSRGPSAAIAVWLLGALLFFALAAAQRAAKTEWVYREELIVKGAGGRWREVAELAPRVFQKLTLQNAEWRLEGNRLTMKMRLERSVLERGQGGSQAVTVDLGPFTVEAVFEDRGGDLAVDALYRGEPPAAHGGLAAEAYERVIVAFRASLDEAWSQLKPKAAAVFDFAKLAELLASRGLVVAAVRCPYCGGSVELPKEGDTTKCPYCGTTLKAIDLYKVLTDMFKALASQA
jgi:endogenous inhibitor of DNA gyrase (YacG/DUF329 family)